MKKRVLAILGLVLGTFSLSPSYADMPLSDKTPAVLKIDFHVKPERLTEFMEIMKGVDSAMQGEEGFRYARVYVNMEDAHKVTLIEGWESRALHEAHYRAINDNGVWPMILDMQVSSPAMGYFSPLTAD